MPLPMQCLGLEQAKQLVRRPLPDAEAEELARNRGAWAELWQAIARETDPADETPPADEEAA